MASRLMFMARGGALAAGLSLLAATATPVCAQKLVALQLDPRDSAGIPFEPGNQQQIDALIQKIKEAKKMDYRGASDYGMDPVIAQDFAVQGKKANRAIRDLSAGQPVSRAEINSALRVPANP